MEIKISEKNLERMQQLYGINEESMREAVINMYIGTMLNQEETMQQIESEQKILDGLKKKLKTQRTIF